MTFCDKCSIFFFRLNCQHRMLAANTSANSLLSTFSSCFPRFLLLIITNAWLTFLWWCLRCMVSNMLVCTAAVTDSSVVSFSLFLHYSVYNSESPHWRSCNCYNYVWLCFSVWSWRGCGSPPGSAVALPPACNPPTPHTCLLLTHPVAVMSAPPAL